MVWRWEGFALEGRRLVVRSDYLTAFQQVARLRRQRVKIYIGVEESGVGVECGNFESSFFLEDM